MKKLIRNILMLLMIFILPTYVSAAEETFPHIDIDRNLNLTYKVDGIGKTHSVNLNQNNSRYATFPSNIKLYRLEQDGTKTEITDASRTISDNNNNGGGGNSRKFRFEKNFDRYYVGTTEEVKYIVEYTFDVDVNGSTEEIVYEKEVSYSSNNDSTETSNKGILVKLEGSTDVDFTSPELQINKILTNGANDGTFKFNIKSYDDDSYDQTFNVTTHEDNGSSEKIKLSANKKYIITEVDIAIEYKFVSMDSSAKVDVTDLPENSIVIETGDWGSELIEIDTINTTKIDHDKNLKDNNDGTYQLSLDVKGENVSGNANKANVIIIYDISGSMNFYLKSDTGRWGTSSYSGAYPRNDTGANRLTLYDSNGNQLMDDNYSGDVYYRYNNRWYQYFGQRYSDETRLPTANQATLDMANELLSYNTMEGNDPDTVEIGLIVFSTNAEKKTFSGSDWTTSYSDFVNAIPDSANGGTNWEDALVRAKALADAKKNSGDNDQTYIVFVTDGNPTYYLDNYGRLQGTGRSTDAATVEASYNDAKDHARALVTSNYVLYDVGIYGDADRMADLTTYAYNSATEGAAHYFDASNTDRLYDAFNTILSAIKKSGIGSVSIADGTTQ